LAAAVNLLAGTSPAAAAGANRQLRANRDAQENAARKACLIGDYANGVSILADLFIQHKDPAYIFNQGRCLEQNLRYRDAIGRFEEFLRISESSKADADARAQAQTHIGDCKVKLLDEERAQTLAARPIPQPNRESDPQPLPKPGSTVEIVESPKAAGEPARSGGGLVIAGMVTGGVGVAAVIAGVAFNLKANSMASEMEGTVDAYTPSKDSSQKNYQTLTWIGYGVGAACIATGTILTVVGMTRSSNRSDVALVPAVGPGQAGVLLHGGF
jgi:tetratricopeptide (TPR) repeat protein